MNKVILSGRLVRDIEMKQTQSGKEVISNCIAVQRDFKNANGEYDSDFINIVVWGQAAVYLKKYAAKGDRVELVGRWQTRKYEDNQGFTKTVNEVVVESITAFSSKKKDEEKATDEKPKYEDFAEGEKNPFDEQDLPF